MGNMFGSPSVQGVKSIVGSITPASKSSVQQAAKSYLPSIPSMPSGVPMLFKTGGGKRRSKSPKRRSPKSPKRSKPLKPRSPKSPKRPKSPKSPKSVYARLKRFVGLRGGARKRKDPKSPKRMSKRKCQRGGC